MAAFNNSCLFVPGTRACSCDTKTDLSPTEDKRHIQVEKENSGTEAAMPASQHPGGSPMSASPGCLSAGTAATGGPLPTLSLSFPMRTAIMTPAPPRVVGKARGARLRKGAACSRAMQVTVRPGGGARFLPQLPRTAHAPSAPLGTQNTVRFARGDRDQVPSFKSFRSAGA